MQMIKDKRWRLHRHWFVCMISLARTSYMRSDSLCSLISPGTDQFKLFFTGTTSSSTTDQCSRSPNNIDASCAPTHHSSSSTRCLSWPSMAQMKLRWCDLKMLLDV